MLCVSNDSLDAIWATNGTFSITDFLTILERKRWIRIAFHMIWWPTVEVCYQAKWNRLRLPRTTGLIILNNDTMEGVRLFFNSEKIFLARTFNWSVCVTRCDVIWWRHMVWFVYKPIRTWVRKLFHWMAKNSPLYDLITCNVLGGVG